MHRRGTGSVEFNRPVNKFYVDGERAGISPPVDMYDFLKTNQDDWDTVLSDAEQELRKVINAQ